VVWRLSCGFSVSCGQQCVFSSLRVAVIMRVCLRIRKRRRVYLIVFFLFVSPSVLTTAREVQLWVTAVSQVWTRVVVGLRKKKNPKDFSEVTHNVHALLFYFFHLSLRSAINQCLTRLSPLWNQKKIIKNTLGRNWVFCFLFLFLSRCSVSRNVIPNDEHYRSFKKNVHCRPRLQDYLLKKIFQYYFWQELAQ